MSATANRIGIVIRSARLAAGLTQLDLAHALHLTLANYTRIEDGRHTVGIADVKRIAEAVGMAPVDLAARVFERWTSRRENRS